MKRFDDGMERVFVAGGTGFIGSHVARRLLERPATHVVVFDNFASGRESHLGDISDHERLTIVRADLKDLDTTVEHTRGCDHVFHFAANPDIAKAATDPGTDFWDGTFLAHNLIEACRLNGIQRFTYASGSGVYGDRGTESVHEAAGDMHPISTYGASKLACEALLSAYCHMFDMDAVIFRFANVVGPRQTHGVAYDFVRRLLDEPTQLLILGDGSQTKSYIHVSDVVDAMLLLTERRERGFQVYNASTEDVVSVREIADTVVQHLGLPSVQFRFTGGKRGWKGDVPVVRLDSSKLRSLGWRNAYSSAEALRDAIDATIIEARDERAAAR